MNPADVIILAALAVILFFIFRFLHRSKKKGGCVGCSGCCSSCTQCGEKEQ